jgi:hypothetical protein
VIDCDILNFAANGECAALTGNDANFGGVSGTTTQVNPETLHGWGVRQHDWQWGITVQHELIRVCRQKSRTTGVVQGREGDRQHTAWAERLRAVHDHGASGCLGCQMAAAIQSRCRC